MPRQCGEPTDQQVIALWLKEQDPETRVRLMALADGMCKEIADRSTNKRQHLGPGGALELLYRVGRKMQT